MRVQILSHYQKCREGKDDVSLKDAHLISLKSTVFYNQCSKIRKILSIIKTRIRLELNGDVQYFTLGHSIF